MICKDPCCDEPGGYGRKGRFCKPHADRLSAITESFNTQGQNMSKAGPEQKNENKVKVKRSPTCCTVGCVSPRIPPNMFCELCIQDGAVQSD